MAASIRSDLRTIIRREIRDEDASAYVFTNTELDTYLDNAIRAYSREIPKEVSADFAITAGEDEYDAPADLRALLSIKAGDTSVSMAWTIPADGWALGALPIKWVNG